MEVQVPSLLDITTTVWCAVVTDWGREQDGQIKGQKNDAVVLISGVRVLTPAKKEIPKRHVLVSYTDAFWGKHLVCTYNINISVTYLAYLEEGDYDFISTRALHRIANKCPSPLEA